jgi:hypothetical protein
VVRQNASSSREIIYDWIVPGNFVAENVIKKTIEQFEFLMNLSTLSQRQRFILRLDSGFGSDACINWLMSRGYHLRNTIMKSGRRANKLGTVISQWVSAPSQNGETDRGESPSRNSQTVLSKNQTIGPTIPKTRWKVVLSRSGHQSLGLGTSKSHSNL